MVDAKGSPVRDKYAPLPLRELITYPVLISVSNYVALAFLNICMNALLPLFFAMPVEIGGLGLSPPKIGLIMGIYGAGCGLYQGLFFAPIVRRWGEKRVFLFSVFLFIPMYCMYPLISLMAKAYGLSRGVWILVVTLLASLAIMDMAYGMFIHSLLIYPGLHSSLSQVAYSYTSRPLPPASAH